MAVTQLDETSLGLKTTTGWLKLPVVPRTMDLTLQPRTTRFWLTLSSKALEITCRLWMTLELNRDSAEIAQ